jgi:dephospho-CoA kinase
MLKIGVTGGIGSGKSTVCKIFEVCGASVYYADDKAKMLMNKDEVLKKMIKEKFGEEAYSIDGKLNRAFLADKVFINAEQLKVLNSIVHPYVFQDTIKWMQAHQNEKYVLYEAAIMFESGSYKMMDKTILVISPTQERISRVVNRDKISKEEVVARINKQMPDEEKLKLANFVIYNDGEHELIPQVLALHKKFISQ